MIINWESKRVAGDSLPSHKAHLQAVVAKGLADLGLPTPADESTLFEADGLAIRFEDGFGENAIDPNTLEAGGEIDLATTGPVPLLLLMRAQKSFREEFRRSEEQIEFCDADGRLVTGQKWSEISDVFAELNLDLEQVRQMAEAIGLISGPLKITADDVVDDDDAWF